MNGIHDLGGMHGLGPIAFDEDPAPFHHEWERRVFGMFLPIFSLGIYNLDELRHAIERMGAPAYLNTSYYEHWLFAYETMLTEKGTLTRAELDARCAQIAAENC